MMKPANYPDSPKLLWDQFFNFTQIPRPSKHEEKIVKYLINFAEENNLKYDVDPVQNVIIYVPASMGRENEPVLIIQNHVDMVTDALPEHTINFLEDPIETLVENGWLKANGTTLGADNGIGCAAALATVLDSSISHPPLELLFTVDEETGLHGAWGVDATKLTGRRMLNLDTEEWGKLYIGCAGGIDYDLQGSVSLCEGNNAFHTYKIEVSGFVGGHSGIDIHLQRGNAIKFLSDALQDLRAFDYELVEFRAGRAHNIIPRDAFVIIRTSSAVWGQIKNCFEQTMKRWKEFLPQDDRAAILNFQELGAQTNKVCDTQAKEKFINLLSLFPHGAHKFDLNSKDHLVSISNNMAKVLLVGDKLYILTSLRFLDRGEIQTIENQLKCLGQSFDLVVTKNSEYPSWKPVWENALLEKIKAVYQQNFQAEPEVTAIHAGLECGILREKIGPIDVVSFGPTIMGAHSPQERIDIASVTQFWNLYKEVLASI